MTKPVASQLARGLSGVPTELVHQILDDLTVGDILKLASYHVPYIDSCIMSHPAWGLFFSNSTTTFSHTRDYFILWKEIQMSIRSALAADEPCMAASVSWAKYNAGHAQDQMNIGIFRIVDLSRLELDILEPYAAPGSLPRVWDSSTLSALRDRWEAIQAAQRRLNEAKARQVMRAAELLEMNPDILQRATDPEQVRRLSIPHIVARMRRDAKAIAGQSIYRRNKSTEYFIRAFFPVVPFNGALGVVVKTLEKYPPPLENQETVPEAGHISLEDAGPSAEGPSNVNIVTALHESTIKTEETRTNPSPTTTHHYPSPIAHDIRTLIQGLPYIYLPRTDLYDPLPCSTTTDMSPIRRTWYTPYSVPPFDQGVDSHEPVFGPDRYTPSWYLRRYPLSRLKKHRPHDEREVQWVEAFVRVYRYLERLEKEEGTR